MPAAVSSTSVGSDYERPVKTVTGMSSAYYLFGLGPEGDDSLNAAIADAMSYAKSDSIANVFVDRRIIGFPTLYFPIVMRIDTIVFGTLVKYTDKQGNDIEQTEIQNFDSQIIRGNDDRTGDVSNLMTVLDEIPKGKTLLITFKNGEELKCTLSQYYEKWKQVMIRPIGGDILSERLYFLYDIKSVKVID